MRGDAVMVSFEIINNFPNYNFVVKKTENGITEEIPFKGSKPMCDEIIRMFPKYSQVSVALILGHMGQVAWQALQPGANKYYLNTYVLRTGTIFDPPITEPRTPIDPKQLNFDFAKTEFSENDKKNFSSYCIVTIFGGIMYLSYTPKDVIDTINALKNFGIHPNEFLSGVLNYLSGVFYSTDSKKLRAKVMVWYNKLDKLHKSHQLVNIT